ncbi:Ku protein [Peredibacter sp. HCB2-198]|uniref:non-homologous end joining protein Ku n=1 Tax=Peredibacter sp. HCB2-198 TaxID=3383025 RepID=UPI0038B5DA56
MAGSIWKGSISFGLLNIPVSLQKAEEGNDLHFSMLDGKDLSPIKYKKVSGKDGKEVPWNRIVKGYEYEKGQFVIIEKDDFKRANPKATQTIDIEDFVDLDEIDPMFLEKPYYLVPQKNGIKGYFLLAEALKKSKKVAIAKVIIRTKQHLGAIMTRGDYLILEILRFSHEVLEVDEVEYLSDIQRPKFSAKEVKMAQELIDGMTGKWRPDQYKDTYNDDLLKIINLKIEAGEGKEVDLGEVPKAEKGNTGVVVDLMPLLKKSLEEKKKGKTAKEAPASKKKTAKKTARKRAS